MGQSTRRVTVVSFSVFNELSLPFHDDIKIVSKFGSFFKILKELKHRNLTTIRMDNDFKNFEILQGVPFYQFLGQQSDQDFRRRLQSFIANNVIKIDSPLIKDYELDEDENLVETTYNYNGNSTFGGLACSDIWNTISISFNSSEHWGNDKIIIQKDTNDINIRHASKFEHLSSHTTFFEEIEKETKLNIIQDNFWNDKEQYFSNIVIFCKEVEKQVKELDKNIFQHAISILRDIENESKKLTNYTYSGESQTVRNDKELKKLRYFTIDNKKVYFDNHIKNLPSANRIYFLEKNGKIYIGYIGKHLPTKKFK